MLIVWSGGLDSTWMLYKALVDTPRGKTIRTISINYSQVSGVKQNKTARNKITKFLARFGSGWKFDRIELNIEIKAHDRDHIKGSNLIQPILWLFHTLLHADDNEEVYIGYIKGDCALTYKHDIIAIKDHCNALTGKNITIEFPLQYTEKYEIIKEINEEGQGWIFENVWWCEPSSNNPNIKKPCGKCASCIKQATAVWQYEQGF